MVDLRSKIPTVSNFLYFFNLITGNIVIGWVHFSLSFVIVVAYIAFLVFKKSPDVEFNDDVKLEVNVNPEGFEGTVLISEGHY